VKAVGQGPPNFTLRIDQPMRDMVFVQKIFKLAALARVFGGENAQSSEFRVPLQPLPPHNKRVHNQLTHARQFRQRLAQPTGGHFEDLAFFGPATNVGHCRGSHERRNISGKITRADGPENLFAAIVRVEYLHCAAQDHSQPDVALAGFVYRFTGPQDAPCAKRFQQGQLPIIQRGMSDTFRIPIKLLVLVNLRHKEATRVENPGLHLAAFLSVSTEGRSAPIIRL